MRHPSVIVEMQNVLLIPIRSDCLVVKYVPVGLVPVRNHLCSNPTYCLAPANAKRQGRKRLGLNRVSAHSMKTVQKHTHYFFYIKPLFEYCFAFETLCLARLTMIHRCREQGERTQRTCLLQWYMHLGVEMSLNIVNLFWLTQGTQAYKCLL